MIGGAWSSTQKIGTKDLYLPITISYLIIFAVLI